VFGVATPAHGRLSPIDALGRDPRPRPRVVHQPEVDVPVAHTRQLLPGREVHDTGLDTAQRSDSNPRKACSRCSGMSAAQPIRASTLTHYRARFLRVPSGEFRILSRAPGARRPTSPPMAQPGPYEQPLQRTPELPESMRVVSRIEGLIQQEDALLRIPPHEGTREQRDRLRAIGAELDSVLKHLHARAARRAPAD
jgi:hypothetical protein